MSNNRPAVYIVAARRTPIGKFMGGLSKVPAPTLGSYVAKALFEQVPAAKAHVDECIMGNVLQAGVGQNPARQVALLAGLPDSVSAVTVNKVCGSGLQAIMQAAQSIRAGDNDVVLAGGIENMDLAPHMMHLRNGVKYGPGTMQDHMANDGLTCAFEKWAMGCACDFLTAREGVSREDQDRFAAQSHQRAAAATNAGHFKTEIVALSAEQCLSKVGVEADEGIRSDTTADGLAKLKPAFGKDGTATAGNASQISDGAAAVLVMSDAGLKKTGATPMARILDANTAGTSPKELFFAPKLGIERMLAKHNLTVADIDLFELNEAFAGQVLADIKPLGIPESKLNICGGGVALGHPIGASGARVLVTLIHQLNRTGGKRGICSLCLGGGNAVTMLIEV